jgi:hypothetical protein
MQVTKLEAIDSIKYEAKKPTDASIKNDHDYLVAENLTKKLLEKGLISQSEFDKIMIENREVFSPFLADIMAQKT